MKKFWGAVVIVVFICLVTGPGYSDDMGLKKAAAAVESVAPAKAALDADIEWLWGEVITVDEAAKTIKVKYLDYETDQEKEIIVSVNEQTTYENVAALNQIHAGDTISVDYTLEAGGANIAKNVSVEKTESENAEMPGIPASAIPPEAGEKAAVEKMAVMEDKAAQVEAKPADVQAVAPAVSKSETVTATTAQ